MSDSSAEFHLYGHVRSGNAYKPALMMSMSKTPFVFHEVDLPGGEQAQDAYRRQSVFATVPMLEHGGMRIRQSGTILLYLASQTGQFGSAGPENRLRISEWMFWEQDQLFVGVGRSRFFRKVVQGEPALLAWLGQVGNRALDTLDAQLSQTDFLAGDAPTIADIACYCYARLAEEAEFDMTTRPAVVAWRTRMENMPGWASPADLLSVS